MIKERDVSFPKTGNIAPAFSLKNQDGEKVSLKDFRDKKNVVLYFYPKAMTPGCTVQACGLRDSMKELEERDVVVLGVSPDPVERLPRFIEKQNLNFTLLSDEDHAVAEKYGCWGMKKFMGKEFMGLIRTTFIIGKDGRLLKIMNKFKTKTHHEDLLAQLDELL
jgi:peroxiredoxin Q/BCP